MAYDELLAERIRARLADLPQVEEKRMMGGLTFMVNGKMCVGIHMGELMCRVDPAMHEALVQRPGARTMDFTKRLAIGYVLVEPAAVASEAALDAWISIALAFNAHAKPAKKRAKKGE